MKAFLLLSILLVNSVYAVSFNEFDHFIEQARISEGVPGVAVVIVQDGKPVFMKGYGVCRMDGQEKVDENTIFQLASVSKTFTAAGLALQVDQKKISWDQELIAHLPQFALQDAYPSRFVNIRDLLAHRSGLPAFTGDLLGKLGYTRNEVLERIRYIKPETSFRNKAYYSNVGYFAAGQAIEKIAETSFEKFTEDHLLAPLKMTRSGFGEKLDGPNAAFAHAVIDGKMQVIPWNRSEVFAAAGGVMSTAKDMGNWMMLHLNEGLFEGQQLIQKNTLKEMHMPSMVAEVTFTDFPPITELSSFSFGLGWANYNYLGKVVVEKGGALEGVRSIVTLIPELGVGITVLANLNLTPIPEMIRARFLEMYAGATETDMQSEIVKLGKNLQNLIKAPQPEKVIQNVHELKDYIGQYHSELYGLFAVTLENDQLAIKAGPARLTGTLQHWSNDTFLLRWPDINSGNELITFTFGPEGKAESFQGDSLGIFVIK